MPGLGIVGSEHEVFRDEPGRDAAPHESVPAAGPRGLPVPRRYDPSLGVTVRGETVVALAVAGTALVVLGAVACARAGR